MAKLTDAQAAVLRYLGRRKEHDMPPTPPEISAGLNHAPYWAAGKVTSLLKRNLIERLGQSFSGGHCYRITDAGLAALKAQEPRS